MDDWVDVEELVEVDLPVRTKKALKSTDVACEFYRAIGKGALARLEAQKTPIFYIDLGDEPVYRTFTKNLASELQTEYACSTCKHFANRYGNLALVNDDGTLKPLLWSVADLKTRANTMKVFGSAVEAITKRFEGASVKKEFKTNSKTKSIGTECRGGFRHMHLNFPESRVQRMELAGFTSATTVELAAMLQHVLDDYDLSTIRKAYAMLKEDKLPYASNHKASAKWLLELVKSDRMGKAKGATGHHNLLYRYAASSFLGSLKQLRSGALSTLLDGVKENLPWESILAQWKNVCDPLHYMRPQVAPSAGNINAAERLFEQLGLTKDDLRRRLLVQEDVPDEVVIWSSAKMKGRKYQEKPKAVFGDIKAKGKPSKPLADDDTPPVSISFTRFVNQVLPKAKRVECWLNPTTNITTCITGLAGTKPLMQWHDDEGKNLASHYVWAKPSAIEMHSLKSNAWNEVRCLIPLPHLWDGAPLTTTFPLLDPDDDNASAYKPYHKQKAFRYLFVFEEVHETKFHQSMLFPEYLKSEFHGVRSTIEAFSSSHNVQDVPDGFSRGGFVAGVEVSRGGHKVSERKRVHFFNGELETYVISLFE